MDTPLVSICCLVYNHEPFLRECFEGFVMQKTTFPIEVLVHDDASTDHSADIIREYTEKYPDIFKPIYQTENQYSKGKGFVGLQLNFERANGKYIAMCEGDDYWTEPLKLQKQVDFLEKNVEYMLCYHSVKLRKGNDYLIIQEVPTVSSVVDLVKGNNIATTSVLFRKSQIVIDSFNELGRVGFGDYPLWFLCAMFGKIKKINENMAVYRVGVGITTTQRSQIRNYIEFCEMLYKLAQIVKKTNISLYLSLEEEIEKTKQKIESYNCEEKYYSVLNSHAFRLGNFLLQPVYCVKKIIKSIRGYMK